LGVDSLQTKPPPESGQSESQMVQIPASLIHWPPQDPDGSATIARLAGLQLQHWQTVLPHHFLNADDSLQIQPGYIAECPDRFHNGDLEPDRPHWPHHSAPRCGWLPGPESSHPVYPVLLPADRRKYLLSSCGLRTDHRHKWYRGQRK